MSDRIPITREGYERIKSELQTLLSVERPAIQKAISEARAHGDLRENAEFHAAKEKQSFIEGRIQEINAKLAMFHVVDAAKTQSETVIFGTRVTVENLETGEAMTYRIVGPDEADIKQGMISVQSPIARALIGKKVGDVVPVDIPRGRIEVEITDLEIR
jgi:transcription elongation factor GreA